MACLVAARRLPSVNLLKTTIYRKFEVLFVLPLVDFVLFDFRQSWPLSWPSRKEESAMSNPIRLIDRLQDLRNRRTEIDNRIRDEMAMPAPSKKRLHSLERLKIRAKDQISMIGWQVSDDDHPTFPTAA